MYAHMDGYRREMRWGLSCNTYMTALLPIILV